MKIGDHVKYRGMVGIVIKHEIRKFVRNGKTVVYSCYTAETNDEIKFVFYGSMIGKTVKKIEYDDDQISLFDEEGRLKCLDH